MNVTGIHHILLAMPEGEEPLAVAFYEGVLGIPQIEKPDDLRARGGCWFDNGSVQIHLGVENFQPTLEGYDRVHTQDPFCPGFATGSHRVTSHDGAEWQFANLNLRTERSTSKPWPS